jgi:hypothetical protein
MNSRKVLEEESLLERRRIGGAMKCGGLLPNCSTSTKAAQQHDIGVTGGRKWVAMGRNGLNSHSKKNYRNALQILKTI